MKTICITTTSAQQTQLFAQQFALSLSGGETLLLQGDLGAGKTHFAKGLAQGLGIDDVVTSPTFTLHNRYEGGRLVFNHFDFYRLDDSAEAQMLGLDEFFSQSNAVSAIEWSSNVADLLPSRVTVVDIRKVDDATRTITVTVEEKR